MGIEAFTCMTQRTEYGSCCSNELNYTGKEKKKIYKSLINELLERKCALASSISVFKLFNSYSWHWSWERAKDQDSVTAGVYISQHYGLMEDSWALCPFAGKGGGSASAGESRE